MALCSHIRIISDNRDPPIATQLAPKETFCNKIFIRPELSHTPQSIWKPQKIITDKETEKGTDKSFTRTFTFILEINLRPSDSE